MNLCVIPARGGSKRIPRKNIRLFCGKPMLAYAVEAAQKAELFAHILVSSDDGEILALAETLGAVALPRPAALADDMAGTVPVIAHAIDAYGSRSRALPEAVCCIYPCVPLLQADDLVRGLALMQQSGADFVFPAARFPSAPQRALALDDVGYARPLFPEFETSRTQDLEVAWFDAGQFYWGRPAAWKAGLPVHSHGLALPMASWRTVDIDTPEDWQHAELIYTALQHTATDYSPGPP